MKIAYLVDYDLNGNNGVIQKILQQSQKWVEAGHTVYYVSTKTLTVYNLDKSLYKNKSFLWKLYNMAVWRNIYDVKCK